MARINLLPWREEVRKKRQRDFITTLVIVALLMGGVVLLVHTQMEAEISYQQARNKYMQDQIKRVDKEIAEIKELEKAKASLLARMRVIETLQRSRPEAVHLFEEVAKTTPDGVYIANLSHKGNTITIAGNSQSNAQVSNYMRNIDSSEWLTQPNLQIIKAQGQNLSRSFGFNLGITQTRPKDPSKAEGDEK